MVVEQRRKPGKKWEIPGNNREKNMEDQMEKTQQQRDYNQEKTEKVKGY